MQMAFHGGFKRHGTDRSDLLPDLHCRAFFHADAVHAAVFCNQFAAVVDLHRHAEQSVIINIQNNAVIHGFYGFSRRAFKIHCGMTSVIAHRIILYQFFGIALQNRL